MARGVVTVHRGTVSPSGMSRRRQQSGAMARVVLVLVLVVLPLLLLLLPLLLTRTPTAV